MSEQRFCGAEQRRPGGTHIVDKHQMLAGDVAFFSYGKDSGHVHAPLLMALTRLGGMAPQGSKTLRHRQPCALTDSLSHFGRLVIAAQGPLPPMHRHRHQSIYPIKETGREQFVGSHVPEIARKPRKFPVLEILNQDCHVRFRPIEKLGCRALERNQASKALSHRVIIYGMIAGAHKIVETTGADEALTCHQRGIAGMTARRKQRLRYEAPNLHRSSLFSLAIAAAAWSVSKPRWSRKRMALARSAA